MKIRSCVASVASLVLIAGCQGMGGPAAPGTSKPTRDRGTASTRTAPSPAASRDSRLEQRLARTELRLLEKEAQVEELQARLDDARREVVRSMAKLQSQATRAEAASGMAEAEIALQSVRATPGAPRAAEAGQLMQLSSANSTGRTTPVRSTLPARAKPRRRPRGVSCRAPTAVCAYG